MLQPYQGTPQLSRQSRRQLDRMDGQHAIELVADEYRRDLVEMRIQNGANLTANLGTALLALSGVQQNVAEFNPMAAARFGYVIDQLAVNGAAITGSYMRGQ